MSLTSAPFFAQLPEGNGTDDTRLTGAGSRLAKDAPIHIDDHARSGPRKGRVVIGGGSLITGDDGGEVFDRTTAIDEGPPIEGFGGSPRIHVGTDADQDLGTAEGQLAARFREEPVVTSGDPETSDLGFGDGEEGFVVSRNVVGAGVNLPRNPRVDLAVAAEDLPFGGDQHRRVEERIGPAGIDLEEGTTLDPNAMFLGDLGETIGVWIGNLDRQLFGQLFHRFVDGAGVGKLGKDDESNVVEGLIPDHRVFQLFDQPGRHSLHLIAVARMGVIGLAAGGVVDQSSSFRSRSYR